jgi:hypothetical protein
MFRKTLNRHYRSTCAVFPFYDEKLSVNLRRLGQDYRSTCAVRGWILSVNLRRNYRSTCAVRSGTIGQLAPFDPQNYRSTCAVRAKTIGQLAPFWVFFAVWDAKRTRPLLLYNNIIIKEIKDNQ